MADVKHDAVYLVIPGAKSASMLCYSLAVLSAGEARK